MTSPRCGDSKPGRRALVPGICAPYTALVTKRKSPTSSVRSMLPLGIWKASTKNVLMMTKRMNAMPTERSQLSNQRAKRERRFSAATRGGAARGATGGGATRAPWSSLRTPKSCMAFTLAKPPARRNGHGPPARRPPSPHPLAEPVGRVVMTHSSRETRGLTLALDPHPVYGGHRERVERGAVERGAARGEDDHQRFVTHRTHHNASGVSRVTRFMPAGAIGCAE